MRKIKTILFDTFGTVLDWHKTALEEGLNLSRKYGVSVDWGEFVTIWRREGYIHPIIEVAKGLRSWEPVDVLHRRKLLELLDRYGINVFSDCDIENFNLVWHRLQPWPDVLPGLQRLKRKYAIGPFSNGDFIQMVDLAKNAGLPWDFILSADIFKKFKPDPAIYAEAIKLIGGDSSSVLMVSAHPFDLDGAIDLGCASAFVPRPLEHGENSKFTEREAKYKNHDFVASDFIELASMLEV